MKKLFCVIAIIACFVFSSRAQQTHFGVKAGLNLSSVEVSSGGGDYGTKAGVHLGGLAHIHITPHFALQPELVYSTQGGKIDDDQYLKLNYINVPLLAQYMVNDGFRLQTGPQLGFLTMAKSKMGDVEVKRNDDFSSVDFSWAFGASYLFPQGWGIDARYNLGITDVAESNTYDAKNRVFQLGLFYQFMHGNTAKRH